MDLVYPWWSTDPCGLHTLNRIMFWSCSVQGAGVYRCLHRICRVRAGVGNLRLWSRMRLFSAPWWLLEPLQKCMKMNGGIFFFLCGFNMVSGGWMTNILNVFQCCKNVYNKYKISTFLSKKICVMACDTRSSVAPCQAVGCCKQTGGCVMGHGSQREKEKGS